MAIIHQGAGMAIIGAKDEIATIQPFVGPFGNVESHQMVWRRTESQASVD